ncbi:hypothetical protein LWI29_001987 [Acer saccharum]|uniref:Phosphoinositide phospholipase C n=1 Tax=Acer saccharum TaxID=4024 RepID=A0AA39SNK2_ACESA|nr:hypothetical protein LWI29_001987 [Acer saccharum]
MWRSSNKYQNRENKTGNYHYKMFKCFNRKFKINEAAPPLDVKLAFVECTNHGDYMTAVQLRRFLVLYQEEKDCSLNHAEMIMEQVVQRRYPDNKSYHGKGLTINDFFIFSCLMILILLSETRTLTAPISLIRCLKTIKEFAFVASAYPVIITLEDHLTEELQAKVAEMITETFGSMLRLSLNELEIERAAASYGDDLVRFSQRNILRIYPKGTRVDSSNFKPLVAWMHGAQMIAFNMQGYGKSLWLMQGMFKANGGCGYVKKPDFLLKNGPDDEVFDCKRNLPVKMTLKVRVYMGDGWRLDFSHTHFDTYSPPDFYTKVFIVGGPADDAKKKTKIITDDWCPVWNEEFTFPLTVPELAILGIEVREHDMSDKDDFGGQTWLPVSEIKPGIRSILLVIKKEKNLTT